MSIGISPKPRQVKFYFLISIIGTDDHYGELDYGPEK
jgi:hypothetical protein